MTSPKWAFRAGDCYLYTEKPERHLWVIITDPERYPEQVISVSVTTFRPYKDASCRLAAGDHPFITHDSCIAYYQAKIDTAQHLGSLLTRDLIELHETSVRDAILRRIIEAGTVTPHMPSDCQKTLRAQDL